MSSRPANKVVFGSQVRVAAAQLRAVPRELDRTARAETRARITLPLAASIRAATATPQQRGVATSVRATGQRVPSITAGGGRAFPSRRHRTHDYASMGDVFFGSEFGWEQPKAYDYRRRVGNRLTYSTVRGRRGPTFPDWKGRQGSFFWPTVRRDFPDALRTWQQIIDTVLGDWADSQGGR